MSIVNLGFGFLLGAQSLKNMTRSIGCEARMLYKRLCCDNIVLLCTSFLITGKRKVSHIQNSNSNDPYTTAIKNGEFFHGGSISAPTLAPKHFIKLGRVLAG